MTDHSEFEHILKRKERQLRVATENRDRLSYEYRTLRSARDIIDQQDRKPDLRPNSDEWRNDELLRSQHNSLPGTDSHLRGNDGGGELGNASS